MRAKAPLYINFSGEDVIEVTPVPIPNTEVKLEEADNSWGRPPVKIGVRQIFLFLFNNRWVVFFCLFFYIKIKLQKCTIIL